MSCAFILRMRTSYPLVPMCILRMRCSDNTLVYVSCFTRFLQDCERKLYEFCCSKTSKCYPSVCVILKSRFQASRSIQQKVQMTKFNKVCCSVRLILIDLCSHRPPPLFLLHFAVSPSWPFFLLPKYPYLTSLITLHPYLYLICMMLTHFMYVTSEYPGSPTSSYRIQLTHL